MLTLKEMDARVGIRDQLSEQSDEPATLVNIFTVAPEDVGGLLSAWADDALFFKSQPGFISAQLHRGIAGSSAFINIAVWETVAQFRAAFSKPEFHARLAAYPDSAVGMPHLFRKVAVQNICVG